MKNIIKSICAIVLLCLQYACNSSISSDSQQINDVNSTGLPSDLQQKKDANNSMIYQLKNRKEKAKSLAEYEGLIIDYKKLRNEIISYTKECNNRGIVKNNDESIQDIDKSINDLLSTRPKSLREWQPKYNYLKQTQSSNSRSTETPPSKKRCSDEASFDKGYSWAGNQRGLLADCDYLFDIAQASDSGPLSHYCFCRGVAAYQNQNR